MLFKLGRTFYFEGEYIWMFFILALSEKCCTLNRQVCLFLKRGANQHATDEEGKDPLSIAVEAANADIVTL